MPYATNDGVSLYYETAGDGDAIAFVGDCGFGAWQWAHQYDALAGPFSVLAYDHRGTGRSDAPDDPYSVTHLAGDLEAVLGDAGVRSCTLVGSGLGGLVAVEYARRFSRAEGLVALGTGLADVDPLELAAPRDDETALRETTRRALSAAFCEANPQAVEDVVAWRADGDADGAGWEAQAAAVAAYEGRNLYEVTTETLVLHGTEDAVWPLDGGRRLAEELPRGSFDVVDGAGHLAQVEASVALNDLLADRTGR